MKDWTSIHSGFTLYWKKQWKKWGFGYAEAEKWIKLGIEPEDVYFVDWLVEEKDCTPELSTKEYIKNLRKEYSREEREKRKWEEKGFTAEECEKWIKAGLSLSDYNFAYYLFKENHSPQGIDTDKIQPLREEYREWQESLPAQEWLDYFYPLEIRSKVEELEEITFRKNPVQSLKLKGFHNLKQLRCSYSQITSLDLSDCWNLEELYCPSNRLKEIKLPDDFIFLRKIDCSNNELTELDWLLKSSGSLKELNISNNDFFARDLSVFRKTQDNYWALEKLMIRNNRFYGNLEPLEKLTDLEVLDIKSTDVEEGIEYLPESVKFLFCDFKKSEERELSKIYQELEPFRSESEDYNYDLKTWKKSRLIQLTKENKVLQEEKEQLQEQKTDLKEQIQVKDEELAIERKTNQESAELMDKFYRQNPPREDLALKNILSKVSNDYLETSLENKQLRKEIQELEKNLETVEKLLELQSQEQQTAQILQTILPNFQNK